MKLKNKIVTKNWLANAKSKLYINIDIDYK